MLADGYSLSSEFLRLACNQKFADEPLENLVEHLTKGNHQERMQAIIALGYLSEHRAVTVLDSLLRRCEISLVTDSPLEGFPGSADGAMEMAAEICRTLAKIDTSDTHSILMRTCVTSKNRFLRAAALGAMGLESNWLEHNIIINYAKDNQPTRVRLAALTAIFAMSGFRLAGYKDLLLSLLSDRSPCVVLASVEALALLIPFDDGILDALEFLLNDNRYCKRYGTTISKFVASYVEVPEAES